MTLKLLSGGKKPKAYRAAKDQASQWTCSRCEQDINVATSSIVTVTQNPMVRKGKIVGGEIFYVCLNCLLRGTLTKV